jgi:FkbM family methyltransferase
MIKASTSALGFGARAPGSFDRAMIAITSRLPNNWLGFRLAIGIRRLVTMRLETGALDVERWGLRMRLHPRDNICEKNLLFNPQMYETVERAELAAEIARVTATGRPFVFVDIGANVGLFSLYVAAQAKGRADILAIEPDPGNMARFQFNLRANPALRIRTFALALGESEGEVAIQPNTRDRGGTRTRGVTDADAHALRIPCRPLLALLRDEGISAADALKIDVEGAEPKILVPFFRDAPASLWPHMVLIEDSSREWPVDLFALFASKGYTVSTRTRQNVVLRRGQSSMGISGEAKRIF